MAFSKTFNYFAFTYDFFIHYTVWLPKVKDSANLPKILHEHSLKNEDT